MEVLSEEMSAWVVDMDSLNPFSTDWNMASALSMLSCWEKFPLGYFVEASCLEGNVSRNLRRRMSQLIPKTRIDDEDTIWRKNYFTILAESIVVIEGQRWETSQLTMEDSRWETTVGREETRLMHRINECDITMLYWIRQTMVLVVLRP